MPNQPLTPARSVRLTDEDWALADAVAADLARESGLTASRADVLRIGLRALARERGVSLPKNVPEKKSRK